MSKKNTIDVQIRHNGGVRGGGLLPGLFGEKTGHDPTKREPLGYGIILIGFRERR
jgi:hypothetical protein